MCEHPTLLKGHFFDLFKIPCAFNIDETALKKRYHELLKITHPDRFVGKTDTEKQYALTLATRINKAWRTLKDPLKRAHYLLQLRKIDPQRPPNALSEEFLSQQIAWQEDIQEASQDTLRLKKIAKTLHQEIQCLSKAFDQALLSDPSTALTILHQWQFFFRLQSNVNEALAAINTANPNAFQNQE